MTWKAEFDRFTQEALQEMKTYSDNTNEEREWMSYVYLDDDDNYQLGLPDYGDESAIKVSPQAKQAQDKLRKGLHRKMWTIHGHPLKDGKIYTGRQYFSSTDICREYCDARDKNEYTVQFLVYPHQQIEKDANGKPTGKKVIHNRVRILVFPNTQTIVAAMKESNPGVDPYAITPETGQNTNAPDGRLVNQAGVNWFAFQEALGKYNCMGIMDLEGPAYGAEGFTSKKLSMINLGGTVGLLAIVGTLWYANKNKQKIIQVVDDLV